MGVQHCIVYYSHLHPLALYTASLCSRATGHTAVKAWHTLALGIEPTGLTTAPLLHPPRGSVSSNLSVLFSILLHHLRWKSCRPSLIPLSIIVMLNYLSKLPSPSVFLLFICCHVSVSRSWLPESVVILQSALLRLSHSPRPVG